MSAFALPIPPATLTSHLRRLTGAERDQVGVFERIGTDRWRLVLPWPKQESKLEILELKK